MLKMIETEKAYLAGLIDGEGSVSIIRATTPNARHGISHQLRIMVFNTDFKMISWVKKTVGYRYISYRKQQSERHKPSYAYSVTAQKAIEVLRAVYPYMITKRAQAEVAFMFSSTIKNVGRKGIEQEVFSFRDECKLKINSLNGNNGGHKLRTWKNDSGELGELPARNGETTPNQASS